MPSVLMNTKEYRPYVDEGSLLETLDLAPTTRHFAKMRSSKSKASCGFLQKHMHGALHPNRWSERASNSLSFRTSYSFRLRETKGASVLPGNTGADDEVSPQSIASFSDASLHNPNTGLQLCTGVCSVTAALWPFLEIDERKALQGACYFVNGDLRWYLKDLPAVVAPSSHIVEPTESESLTDDDDDVDHQTDDSEINVTYHALPRRAG